MGIASEAKGSGRCAQPVSGAGTNRLDPVTPPAVQKPAAVASEEPVASSEAFSDVEFDQAQQFLSAIVELPISLIPATLELVPKARRQMLPSVKNRYLIK